MDKVARISPEERSGLFIQTAEKYHPGCHRNVQNLHIAGDVNQLKFNTQNFACNMQIMHIAFLLSIRVFHFITGSGRN